MRKQFILMLSVICALVLIGCSKSATETNRNAASSTTSPKPAASAPSTATASGEKIGVAECDEFITKYDACVNDKVTEAARAQYRQSIEQWRNSWRTLAANPQTRATLADACKKT